MIVFSTFVIKHNGVVRTYPTLIYILVLKENNFKKCYQFVFRMKTVLLLLLSTQFGIGSAFFQELNFPDEDLEDSLYGTGDVLENNDSPKSNGEAMPCCHFDESVDVNEKKTIKLLVRLKKITRRVFGDQNKDKFVKYI